MYVGVGHAVGTLDPSTETLSRVSEETLTLVPDGLKITVPTVTGPVTPSPMPSMIVAGAAMTPPAAPSLLDRVRALPPWALVGGAAAVVLVGVMAFRGGPAT